MSDKLQDARQLLIDRIAELDSEREQLAKALARLEDIDKPSGSSSRRGSRSSGRRRSSGRSKRGKLGGKRAPRGEREKQLINSIKSDPSRRVSDHARQIGVRPQQLYPILNRLVETDKLEKAKGRYQLKS